MQKFLEGVGFSVFGSILALVGSLNADNFSLVGSLNADNFSLVGSLNASIFFLVGSVKKDRVSIWACGQKRRLRLGRNLQN